MRIAVVAPPWLPVPPRGYGGTELVLDTLCRGLVARGHEVLLYATGDSTCPVVRAWSHEQGVGVARMLPQVELAHAMDGHDAARAWRADVVHDHTVSGPAWSRSLPPGPPVVATHHGRFDEVALAVHRRTAPSVPLIAISHHQASTARGVRVAAVIHHGLDVDAVDPGPGGDDAVFLGRMSPDKGVHTAIAAARLAGVRLRIAAKLQDQQEREYFEARIRPLLGAGVEFLGEVRDGEKHRLLASARCLLNPIDWPEPFGMVMLESLARGTPVVTTPHGAAPEIVDDGVTGFVRQDVEGLALALRQVRALDRRACRREAETRFSMDRLAADHERVYADLLSDRRATLCI